MSNDTLLFAFNPLYGAFIHLAMDYLLLKCQSSKWNLIDEQSGEKGEISENFEQLLFTT